MVVSHSVPSQILLRLIDVCITPHYCGDAHHWRASAFPLSCMKVTRQPSSDMLDGATGAVDESAWPSLGMASAPSASGPTGGTGRQQRHEGYGSHSSSFADGSSNGDLAGSALGYPPQPHRRSPSSLANAASQDLLSDQNVPPHLVEAFATAQVGPI